MGMTGNRPRQPPPENTHSSPNARSRRWPTGQPSITGANYRSQAHYVGILRGGLVQLLSVSANWREGQVILYPDGQLFARIPEPKGQMAGFGGLSASPSRRMVAYILTNDSGNGSTIFLVRPGSAPVAVYRTARGPSPCAPAPLAWHGSWLLYSPYRGHAVIQAVSWR
jgi:hypothetical protein